jgi:predicted ArsR family transcriptional regulator
MSPRFLETTRGRVLAHLRRGPATVEELAQALGLTDNAIRPHLTALERDGLVRQTGVRRGPGPAPSAGLEERVRDAAALLNQLGGDVTVEQETGGLRIRGSGCPLSATVARRPEACRAVQGLLAEVIGAPVVLCCEREPRPRCCFTVPSAA